MLPSMYSGVTGLQTHQVGMDVIANDIANVNTVGYKESEITFKDSLYATIKGPAPETSPIAYGLGVTVGQIYKNYSDGVVTQTGVSSNLAISGGPGFFVTAKPGAVAGEVNYTRAGDFIHDPDLAANDGSFYLMNSSGQYLQGAAGVTDATGLTTAGLTPVHLPAGTVYYVVGSDGVVRAYDQAGAETVWGIIPTATFANNYGLEAIGDNLYKGSQAAGAVTLNNSGTGALGQMYQGYLEASNVDLSKEFTQMIITERGFQANSRSITTADEMLQELLNLKR